MTAENFESVLRASQHRRPFRPFTISLINGDRFRVKHPEALVFRGGTAVYIAPGEEIRIFDYEGVQEFISSRRTANGRS
jgi:hypothetical protein